MANFIPNKLTRPQLLKINLNNSFSSSSIDNSDDEIHSIKQKFDSKTIKFKYVTNKELEDLLKRVTNDVVIVDIRSNRFYQMSHIKDAVNYSCTKKFMSRRSRVRWTSDSSESSYKTVVVYDDYDLCEKSPVDALKFLCHIQKYCDDVRILSGGFSMFIKHCSDKYLGRKMSSEKLLAYAQSPTHKESLSSDVMRSSLSEIIPGLLYLGNELDARDKDLLKEHKITDIINVTSNVPFYFENKFKYHRLPASDSDKQDISQYFNEAYKIIEEVRISNGRVFIHCWAGVSRSVTIALMYLIKTRNLDVLDALKYIQERRGIADPNLNFLGQLSKLKQNS